MHYSSRKKTFFSFGMLPLVFFVIFFYKVFFDGDHRVDTFIGEFNVSSVVLFPFPFLFLFIAIYSLNYIEIHNEEIIIKNLILFWKKKIYKISEITYIAYIDKRTSKGYWEGIEIMRKGRLKDRKYWLATSFIDDDSYEILKLELKKENIKLNDNRLKMYG